MTATPDIDQVDETDEQPVEPTPEPVASKPKAKAKEQATHTNVPAPLAGPKRRAALALGLPGAGLTELLVHANFGWPGVLIGTGTALAGAGVAYTVHRRRKREEAEKAKRARGVVSPSTGVVRKLAGRMSRRPGAAVASRADGGAAGGSKRSAAGRLLSRVAGAGRGRAGVAGGAAGKRTQPGARTAAKAAQARHGAVAGGRRSRGGLGFGRKSGSAGGFGRRGRSHSAHSGTGRRSAGRSAVGRLVGRAGGSRSTGHKARGVHGGGHAGVRRAHRGTSTPRFGAGRARSSWGHGTSRHNPRRPPSHGHARTAGAPGPTGRSPITRHHSRIKWGNHRRELGILGLATGGVLLAPFLAPAALGVVGVLGTGIAYGTLAAGGYWLATNPRIRYGANTIAGWTRLGVSKAYAWARQQWWKARGKNVKPNRVVVDAETVDEPYTPTARPEPTTEVLDAEVVPDPPVVAPTLRMTPAAAAVPPARHQPALTAAPHVPTAVEISRKQESTMQHVVEAITNSDTFIPTDGPDAQRYVESIGNVLTTLAAKVAADIESIARTLPQFEESLQNLAHLGDAIGAVAGQADQQVAAWRESAAWVWQGQG